MKKTTKHHRPKLPTTRKFNGKIFKLIPDSTMFKAEVDITKQQAKKKGYLIRTVIQPAFGIKKATYRFYVRKK